MAEPLSIASGVAGIITLSSAVVAAGYKYFNSVRSAPEEIKSLIREAASLNTLVAQLVTHSLSGDSRPRNALDALSNQDILQDCQKTLLSVQKHLQECEIVVGSRGKNAIKVLSWPLKRDDVVKGREHISRLCAILTTALTLDSAASLARIEHMQQRSIEHTTALFDVYHDIEEQKMLDWLSTSSPRAKHTATTSLQQPGTSDWLLQKQIVIDWVNGSQFMWLYGPSGCGKTVLISNMIEHLVESRLREEVSNVITYHYCEFTDPSTLDPVLMLGSIVRQLAEQVQPFPQAVREAYHKRSRETPAFALLKDLLHRIANALSCSLYVIIDGVDECQDRALLLNMLEEMRKSPSIKPGLKIMVSSRPEYDLHKAWSSQPSVHISPTDVERSLEMHVQNEIARMPKMVHLQDVAKADLVSTLVCRADGMFRWVQCQLDALRKIRTHRALRVALRTLPESLFETYDRILERVDDHDYEHVSRALKWMIGATRPLSLEELAEAIAIDPTIIDLDAANRFIDTSEILEICSSLLTLRPGNMVVLAHFSVREYFLSDRLARKPPSIARFAMGVKDSYQHITRSQLTYIYTIGTHIQELGQDTFDESRFPLWPYIKIAPLEQYLSFDTVRSWIEAHFPSTESEYRQLVDIIKYDKPPTTNPRNYIDARFVQDVLQSSLMCYWNELAAEGESQNEAVALRTIGSQVASMYHDFQHDWDNPENLQNILPYSDLRNGSSPICTAAVCGFVHCLRSLLDNGASINGIHPPQYIGNPLLQALAYGQEVVVNALGEYGADFNIRSRAGVTGTVLLSIACHNPRSHFFERFLQRKALDVNTVDSVGRTIHYWADRDSRIAHGLQPYKHRLEKARAHSIEYHDKMVLYSTVVSILHDMLGCSTIQFHYGRFILSKALSQCGPQYIEYASIVDEQAIIRAEPIQSAYVCDSCPFQKVLALQGARFTCLTCMDVDLCADCFNIWKERTDGMQWCQGHNFREIPRPCWYTLKPGTVTEDGKTLPEVIAFLYDRFKELLDVEEKMDKLQRYCEGRFKVTTS